MAVQRNDELTLGEKMKIVQILSIYPALTVMVFSRRKLGFRMLKPSRLIGVAMLLVVVNDVFGFFNGLGFWFSEYPWIFLGFAFFQRWRRWQEICRGERWHTMSPGISFLEDLPLPEILTSHRRIYRFVEPVAYYILGCILVHLGLAALGRWIAFAGFCSFIFEQTVYERQLDRDLDTLDGLVAAEVQAETAEHFSGDMVSVNQRTLTDTAGIPTGVAFDIHRQIEKRRARQAVKPEKYATEATTRIVQVNVAAPSPAPLAPPSSPVAETPPPAARPAIDNLAKDEPENPA